MLIMTYTAGSYILGFCLMTSILAIERNDTDDFGNVTPTIPISSTNTNSTMTAVTNATLSETNISQTYSSTTQVPTAIPKLPDDGVTPTPSVYPPIPTLRNPTTSTKSKDSLKDLVMPTPVKASEGSDGVGYIILGIIIIIALLAGFVCYLARSRGRRYSVDLTSRPDEVQMPLNTVEPERPIETVAANGLHCEGTGNITQQAQEPEMTLEVEQKAETEKAVESTGSAADHNPEEQNKDVPEKSPSAPVEPSTDGKPEDVGAEGNDSQKNSVDPLKESNDNNSDGREGDAVWDVSRDNV